MAKARSRAAARRMKDKWKAKSWYNVLSPASFDHLTIAETLSDEPDKLINRVTEVSLQDLTNDFRKSHYKLYFKINRIEDTNAYTQYVGHTLTSDYLRRMVRRKRSKIDAVYDVNTRDGAKVRIKPFTTTDHRIQNSQKKVIREAMKQTIIKQAKASTLSEFLKYIFDGKIGKDIYQSCKKLYPVKRVEIYKTQVLTQPRIQIEDTKIEKLAEEPKEKITKKDVKPEVKEKVTKKSEEKTKEESIEKEVTKKPKKKTSTKKKETKKPVKESVKEEEKELKTTTETKPTKETEKTIVKDEPKILPEEPPLNKQITKEPEETKTEPTTDMSEEEQEVEERDKKEKQVDENIQEEKEKPKPKKKITKEPLEKDKDLKVEQTSDKKEGDEVESEDEKKKK